MNSRFNDGRCLTKNGQIGKSQVRNCSSEKEERTPQLSAEDDQTQLAWMAELVDARDLKSLGA